MVDGKTDSLQKSLLQLYGDIEIPVFDASGHLRSHWKYITNYHRVIFFLAKSGSRTTVKAPTFLPISYTEFNIEFQSLRYGGAFLKKNAIHGDAILCENLGEEVSRIELPYRKSLTESAPIQNFRDIITGSTSETWLF